MIGAMASFVINDAFVSTPASRCGGQLIVIRGLFAIVFLFAGAGGWGWCAGRKPACAICGNAR